MMLQPLLEKPRGSQLEFLARVSPEPLLETIVAFANSEGGQIVLGVDEHGQVHGGVSAEQVEALLHQIEGQVRPPVRVEMSTYELPPGTVVVLRVPRTGELHSLSDGRVLARRGSHNELQIGSRLALLAAGRATGAFEMEPVPGATLADFDREVVAEYEENRQRRQPLAFVGPTEALLRHIGALTEDGTATVMGVLLFGREPQRFLPQSGLTFVKFAGSEYRGADGRIGYGRREDIHGPLPRVIERAWQVVREEMDKRSVVRGLVREEETEYPDTAVREALVNAVAHRDYHIAGRRIEVLMYRDRLEITSPGGLPGYITLQNILDEHYSRNPRLVNGLWQWGYIEELGLGVNKMFEAMAAAGHPPPEYKASPYAVTVILRKGHEVGEPIPRPEWQKDMNERQLRALQFVQREGRITNKDYRELCPDVSAETLRLDLVDLVEKGLLLKIGDKKGTYYVLKRKAGQSEIPA